MKEPMILDHPLLQHKVSHLRDVNTGTKEFKELVSEIAMLMCYEATRDLPTEEVEITTPITTDKFKVLAGRHSFFCVASNGGGWEHVSVSPCNEKRKACPTWEEMCEIKDLFWGPDECVIQYHPPKSDYVNRYPYCLHLWRPIGQELPRPPKEFV